MRRGATEAPAGAARGSPGGVLLVVLTVLTLLAACGVDRGGEDQADPTATRADAAPRAAEINVAAASDLRVAFEELGAAFEQATGTRVVFTFGSSGQLATQILNGAPFDLFASADLAYVDEVIAAGKGDAGTKATYAFGRIALFSPDGSVTALADLVDDDVRSIAIANPNHAPYGVAAQAALRAAGVYDAVAGRLVLGENVSDTLRLATSGNADAAIVALSLVITGDDTTWALVDDALHPPLEQGLVVTATGPGRRAAATAFAAFVNGPEGRPVMDRYGFVLPDEGAG